VRTFSDSVGAGRSGPIERKGKLPGQMLGKSPWLQSVLIDGGEIGDVVEVEIVRTGPMRMHGERRHRVAA
jgi:tRNA-2-methylthio-N6-dimethylallyladenosine synthase